jgi:chromosome segregation ATPase
MTTHGSVAKSMRETIERLRAEVAQAEGVARGYMLAAEKAEAEVAEYRAEGMVPAGAWAHDLEQLKKLEAERDALRADLSRTLAEVERPFRERIERAEAALREIESLAPSEYVFPADWGEQIKACPECLRYKDHPIQQGICDLHRRPLYARESHDAFEAQAIGPRAQRIARDALRDTAPDNPADDPSVNLQACGAHREDIERKHAVLVETIITLRAELRQAEVLGDQAEQELEEAEAERDALTEKLSLVTEDYIKERNAATTAEAELRRAEKLWGAAQARADVANVALLDAVKVQGQLRVARAALGEWREAESSPDCIACCTLDAALAGPQP